MSKQKNHMTSIDDSNFVTVISESKKPVLVFFNADWSGPSQKMVPIVEGVASEFASEIDVRSANADFSKDSIARLGIRKAPTCALFINGRLEGVRIGIVTREHLSQFVSQALA